MNDEIRPKRRKRPPSGSGQSTTIVLVLVAVGAVLGLSACCGLGVVIYAMKGSGGLGLGGADLSDANVAKVHIGMTLPEVEAVLGKGRLATESDMEDVNGRAARFKRGPVVFRQPGATKYVWRSGTKWYFGDFDDRTNKLTGSQSWSSSS